jgi:hypothetical protein
LSRIPIGRIPSTYDAAEPNEEDVNVRESEEAYVRAQTRVPAAADNMNPVDEAVFPAYRAPRKSSSA